MRLLIVHILDARLTQKQASMYVIVRSFECFRIHPLKKVLKRQLRFQAVRMLRPLANNALPEKRSQVVSEVNLSRAMSAVSRGVASFSLRDG